MIKTRAAFGIQMLRESVDELDDFAPRGGGGDGCVVRVVSDSGPAAALLMSRSARLHM